MARKKHEREAIGLLQPYVNKAFLARALTLHHRSGTETIGPTFSRFLLSVTYVILFRAIWYHFQSIVTHFRACGTMALYFQNSCRAALAKLHGLTRPTDVDIVGRETDGYDIPDRYQEGRNDRSSRGPTFDRKQAANAWIVHQKR
jgi:hypothetical protein